MVFTSAKKEEGVIGQANSEAWNIADGYTKIKILRPLIEMDLYECIAEFGYKDLDEKNTVQPHDIPERRFEGLVRVMFTLKQVIGNCKFAIRKNEDKELLDKLLDRVAMVESMISGCGESVRNDVTKEEDMIIHEEHFRKCFNVLRSVKDDLNHILDKASLIFRHSDETDLDELMRSIYEG